MLSARVLSEGIRAVYPAVLVGFYTPEEIRDSKEEDLPNNKSETKVKHEDHIDAEYEEIQEENNNHEFNIENVKNEINACTDMDSLKDIFSGYYHIATKLCVPPHPQAILDEMIAAKDKKKAELTIIEEKNKSIEPWHDAANVGEMENSIVGIN